MTHEIVRRPAPTLEETYRVAKGFAMSGYFPDAKSAEQALVKIMAGGEMGLLPFQSMKGIDIIKGQPVLKPALLAGLLDASPEYDYETDWEPDQANATACTITIYKHGKKRGESRFSIEDAERAQLAGKENYQKYPPNMLRERAMGNAVRWYAPGLIMGPAYLTGEIVPDPLPPHIQALDAQPPSEVVDATPTVIPYVAADDPLDDVPFEDSSENAAPAASNPAESPPPTGPAAAEPAGDSDPGGLTIIDTLADAQRLVNMLDGPQLGVLKQMLGINQKTTRRLMADALLEQRNGWDSEDVLSEIGGLTA